MTKYFKNCLSFKALDISKFKASLVHAKKLDRNFVKKTQTFYTAFKYFFKVNSNIEEHYGNRHESLVFNIFSVKL